MTCHYGKEAAALQTWLVAQCGTSMCTFDDGTGCNGAMCDDGRVRTLLAATPVGCNEQFAAAWRTLRQTCGRQDGTCCATCDGPVASPCSKTPRLAHKQIMTVYTATAAMALTALWLTPPKACAVMLPTAQPTDSMFGLSL